MTPQTRTETGSKKKTILSVRDFSVSFHVRRRSFCAIRDVSLNIREGEVLALVGETGSGKTVLTRAFSGLLPENGSISSGQVLLDGKPLSDKEVAGLCGSEIAFVFQEPATALDPVMKVGDQIAAVIRRRDHCSRRQARRQAVSMMERVGIEDAEQRFDDYPFQYSGGMLQRIVIAIALSCRPRILICDEATTALDVTVQAKILDLLQSLQKEQGFSMVFITHDFGVVARVADRVAVMYAGEIIEEGTAEEIFYDARHPYTWALIESLPQLARPDRPFACLRGTQPRPGEEPEGDPFSPRNPYRLRIDTLARPPLFSVTETHTARTWLLHPDAPKIEKPEALRDMRQTLRHSMQTFFERPGGTQEGTPLLCVRKAEISYGSGRKKNPAVRGVSFEICRGEIFALVGESGSGKTTIGKAVAGFLPLSGGEIVFSGETISGSLQAQKRRELRRRIQMVFQNPALSQNDRMTAGRILTEGLDNFTLCEGREEKEARIREMLEAVGLLSEHLSRYPHELSGGQRQRLSIARAMILDPSLVVADEPVASLDVSVRAQVLNLIRKFSRERGTSFLFISHDLSVVRLIADRIAVMRQGQIVETGETEELFHHPKHPYTRELLASIPVPDPQMERAKRLQEETWAEPE